MLMVVAGQNHPLELAGLLPERGTNPELLFQLQPASGWIQRATCSILNSWHSCT